MREKEQFLIFLLPNMLSSYIFKHADLKRIMVPYKGGTYLGIKENYISIAILFLIGRTILTSSPSKVPNFA